MEIVQEMHGFDLSSRVCHTDYKLPFAQWHKNAEIIQILENDCKFLVNGVFYETNVGDIMVIKPQVIHRCFFNEQFLGFRLIHFNNKIILNTINHAEDIQVHIKAEEIRKVPYLEETLTSFFEIADREGRAYSLEENPFFQSLLMSIYFLLLRHFPADEREESKEGEQNDFYRVVEYINKNFKKHINIGVISQILYISRSRLTKLFIKYAGMGVNEYITSLRINNANHMLSLGHSVTEAALESGFQSIRTFNNTYKDYMGITPSEYQKQQKTDTKK